MTHQERRVFLFLSFLFALGLALSVFKKTTGCSVCPIDFFSQRTPSRLLDVNTAGRQELISLPGIGEKTADAILTYRVQEGGFKDLSELKKIKGISETKLEQLKKYLYIKTRL